MIIPSLLRRWGGRCLLLLVALGLGLAWQSLPAEPCPCPAPKPREGMWIPLLLEQYNIGEMRDMGMELTADDIYSVNHSSLKDAIVSFGGFCTASVVSDQGLLLTNHHCGYRQIQKHSTVENDLLKNGFWADSLGAEKPNPGLSVTFIERIEDVTQRVTRKLSDTLTQRQRERRVDAISEQIIQDATEDPHLDGKIKAFYEGNEYYLFVTKTYQDIRLVAAPPSAIGKFGGDRDNWMWPRHTGDFSLFRIYAGPDNEPAEYAEENVPYKPEKQLSVSLGGLEKGDFTMVFGFPGRTEQYLTSEAVKLRQKTINPLRIHLRGKRINVMDRYMSRSDSVRIAYAAKQSGVSNGWKKWRGQNRGLRRLDAIEKKLALEQNFADWMNERPYRRKQYGGLVGAYKNTYAALKPVRKDLYYVFEALYPIEIMQFAFGFRDFLQPEELSDEKRAQLAQKQRKRVKNHFKDYHAPLDREICGLMLAEYFEGIRPQYRPEAIYETIQEDYDGDYSAYAAYLFEESYFAQPGELRDLLANPRRARRKLADDPVWQLASRGVNTYLQEIRPVRDSLENELARLDRKWVEAMRKMRGDEQMLYPNANSTMRIAYGQVQPYEPYDGAFYEYQTTLKGIIQKHDTSYRFYDVPQKLRQLYESKDYGRYGEDGQQPVCFIASNHTAGGNSGSPVLNAKGHLIGLNFDRNWEGTMSDIIYDPNLVRNISVDIRYVLFVIDKFAGAERLVEEMRLVE